VGASSSLLVPRGPESRDACAEYDGKATNPDVGTIQLVRLEAVSPVLPIISLDKLGNVREESVRLREATHDVGFFYLVDHGVPSSLERDLLRVGRELFALPDADKAAIDMMNSPHFRGFTRLGGERTQGRQDWREQIDIGAERPTTTQSEHAWDILEGPNQWPAALPELRDVTERWQEQMAAIARRLLHAWAAALEQEETVFDAAFATSPSTLLKLIRYPAVAPRTRDGQGVGAHKDPGVLTLLWIEPGAGGLEVQRDSAWIEARPVHGSLVVNIGELLEWATDGYLRATVHRVLSPTGTHDRISVPFFFNPALNARIPRLELPASLRRAARGVEDDPRNVITDCFGANLLKARLRAHPDVAARHHLDMVTSNTA
jgi:isopenicillin N synthase-like dioxygenase